MVQALDCLSRTASRYGRRAKKVFESNREPIVNAIQLSNAYLSRMPKQSFD